MGQWRRPVVTAMAAAVIGIAGFACAQEPADGQQPTGQPSVQPQDAQSLSQSSPDQELAAEVQQLRAEVDQLQSQVTRLSALIEQLQSVRTEPEKPVATTKTTTSKKGATATPKKATTATSAPPAAASPGEPDVPLTVLVFQDGHRTEARNYAIVGQTLWIYTEQDSKKVPLADLDVNATKSANSDRGIVFQVPATTK